MPTATLSEIKKELKDLTREELRDLCHRLGRFKVDNKSLLTYELLYKDNESAYVEVIKEELSDTMALINTDSYFYMKKTIRKVLRQIRLFSRLSRHKSTEIELLLFFCSKLNQLEPSIHHNNMLHNLYARQIAAISKKMSLLHKDLQYDYNLILEELKKPLK